MCLTHVLHPFVANCMLRGPCRTAVPCECDVFLIAIVKLRCCIQTISAICDLSELIGFSIISVSRTVRQLKMFLQFLCIHYDFFRACWFVRTDRENVYQMVLRPSGTCNSQSYCERVQNLGMRIRNIDFDVFVTVFFLWACTETRNANSPCKFRCFCPAEDNLGLNASAAGVTCALGRRIFLITNALNGMRMRIKLGCRQWSIERCANLWELVVVFTSQVNPV